MIKQIVQKEATVFFIQLPAYGSIYYERDLEPNCRRVKIPDRNGVKQLCIGLNTALGWWHDYRDLLPVDHSSVWRILWWLVLKRSSPGWCNMLGLVFRLSVCMGNFVTTDRKSVV